MKKITKTTERNWQCPYCGFLNDLANNTCEKCGAVRNGDEVEKEITTNFEETTTTETAEVSDVIISTRNGFKAIIGIIVAILVVFAITLIVNHVGSPNSRSGSDGEQYTILSRDWEYTINIGEFVEETGITSFTQPPKGATNVTTRQVQQQNGWYKTEYTYDYADWKVVRTETITGSGDLPTYKEYTPKEGEKIMSTLKTRYTVTVMTASGKKVISLPEEKWVSLIVGNTYPSSEF